MRTELILRLQALASGSEALSHSPLPESVALHPILQDSDTPLETAQIICPCTGKSRVHIGRGNSPDFTVELFVGELLLIAPGIPYSLEPSSKSSPAAAKQEPESSLAVGIGFNANFFQACAPRFEGNPLGEFLLKGLSRGTVFSCLHIPANNSLPYTPLLEILLSVLAFPCPGGAETAQVAAELLLIQIFSHPEGFSSETAGRIRPVLAALSQIQNNYPQADLTQLSEDFHISLPSLSSAIHGATGRTFKDLLLEKRMWEAARLLSGTDLPVESIISAVGYDNTSYFYRRFRQRFGVSPRQYRKSFEASSEISD